jgi:DNA-binding NarL/FixJ family response regulator
MMPLPFTIHVVLADDHSLVRCGIRALLSSIERVYVLAEVSDGEELLNLLQSVQPDVVITDLTMPVVDGFIAIARIRKLYPRIRIIALSMLDSADSIKRAVAAGAHGYVLKDAPAFELELALRNVLATGRHFGAGVVQRLLEPTEPAIDDDLTERQIEILTLLAKGKASKEIAFVLGLSSKTVDVHRSRIMDRLQLYDIASLTLYAIRKGLVTA